MQRCRQPRVPLDQRDQQLIVPVLDRPARHVTFKVMVRLDFRRLQTGAALVNLVDLRRGY